MQGKARLHGPGSAPSSLACSMQAPHPATQPASPAPGPVSPGPAAGAGREAPGAGSPAHAAAAGLQPDAVGGLDVLLRHLLRPHRLRPAPGRLLQLQPRGHGLGPGASERASPPPRRAAPRRAGLPNGSATCQRPGPTEQPGAPRQDPPAGQSINHLCAPPPPPPPRQPARPARHAAKRPRPARPARQAVKRPAPAADIRHTHTHPCAQGRCATGGLRRRRGRRMRIPKSLCASGSHLSALA